MSQMEFGEETLGVLKRIAAALEELVHVCKIMGRDEIEDYNEEMKQKQEANQSGER